MPEEEVVRRRLLVRNREGLHARPAAELVKLASQFQSRIELVRGDQRVDGKSIMDVMTLAAEQGTELELEVRGSDAQAASEAIEKLFSKEFGGTHADSGTSEP